MAISIVQHVAKAQAAGSSSIAITVAATSAGNLLVVIVGGNPNTVTISSVTDNATGGSNTYAQRSGARGTDASRFIDCWRSLSAAHGGATTITITGSGANVEDAEFWEVSGFTTAGDDVAAVVNNGVQSGGTATGAAVTTTSTTGFIVAGDMTSAGVTANPKAGNEFTSGGDIDANSNAFCSLISTTAASHQPAWSDTGTSFTSNTVAFKETAGGFTAFSDDGPYSVPQIMATSLIARFYDPDQSAAMPLFAAADDCVQQLCVPLLHLDPEAAGFVPVVPQLDPAAQEEYIQQALPVPLWPDIDLSGFTPATVIFPPSALEDDLQQLIAAPPAVAALVPWDDAGFAPAAVIFPPAALEDDLQQLWVLPGTMASLIAWDDSGFVPVAQPGGGGLYYWYGVWPQ